MELADQLQLMEAILRHLVLRPLAAEEAAVITNLLQLAALAAVIVQTMLLAVVGLVLQVKATQVVTEVQPVATQAAVVVVRAQAEATAQAEQAVLVVLVRNGLQALEHITQAAAAVTEVLLALLVALAVAAMAQLRLALALLEPPTQAAAVVDMRQAALAL